MEERLASLDDEERREVAAIRERYADIRPHVSAAAVVFALTPQDAAAREVHAMTRARTAARRRSAPASCTAPGWSWSTPTGRSSPCPRSSGSGRRACRSSTRPPGRPVGRQAGVREGWESWDRDRDDAGRRSTDYRAARDAWVDDVLRDVLGWGELWSTDVTRPLPARRVTSPDQAVTVDADRRAACTATRSARWCWVVDPVDSLRDPLDDGWAASPIDRMEELLRASRRPDRGGHRRALVGARQRPPRRHGRLRRSSTPRPGSRSPPPATRSSSCSRRRRLLGGKPEDRLPALFAESVAAAEEITEALGVQVRRAVELLVAGVLRERRGRPRPRRARPAARGPATTVYEAAVTVMMRVVFLLFAEERGLLPQGQLFTVGYGISGELDALDARAREEGAEALDATHLTWHRLLATSQALYPARRSRTCGCRPTAARCSTPTGSRSSPRRRSAARSRCTVSDRVMLEVLRAVQVATAQGPGRPADLVPRHRRRADRLHLRGPARLHLRATSTRSSSA